jgi:hypothetical protein
MRRVNPPILPIHPAPGSAGRAQEIMPESLDAIDVSVSVQDLERLLAGDPDPELRERLLDTVDDTLYDLYSHRRWR